MALVLPNWLTKEYLQNSLQNGTDCKVTIQDFKVDMAVSKGNNFVCNVYRVSVEYINLNDTNDLQRTSLIIKEPIYGPMYDTVIKTIIDIEVKFYNVLAPKLNSIFVGNDISDEKDIENHTILPKSYVSSEKNVIVLEDLKPKGYLLTDRSYRSDYVLCVALLKALAKYHAGGKVIIEKEPEMIELFKMVMDRDEMKKSFGALFMANFKNLADEFKNHPELEKYSNWLYENYETGLDKAFKLMDPKENEFNVLIHGDFGLHNLLIKYTDNVPANVSLIDFQGCRYSTPVVDIFYFIELFIEEDVRENKFDELLHIYVTELNYYLEKYGSNSRLEESVFRRYIEERSYLRIFYTFGGLPIIIGIPTTAESEMFELNDLTEDKMNQSGSNPFQKYAKNETLIKIITKRLQGFEKIGLIKIN